MNKDFVQYIGTRCDKSAVNDPEYKRIQKELVEAQNNNDFDKYSELSVKLEMRVQEICYSQGFCDAMQFVLSSKEA